MWNVRDAITTLASRAHLLDISLHSVLVSVADETVASAACPPLGPDVPQRMYSVGKTLTGIAVGMLAREGRLSLDDPILTHFPEMAPVHPFVAATKVRHLLAMQGPHQATTYVRTQGRWLESYFRVPPTHPPGTLFTYDTSGSYVLSTLVERVSGESITSYLRPRLLDPLGVSPHLRILPGPEGTEHGGSGLICTARDLLKIAQGLLAVRGDGGGDGDTAGDTNGAAASAATTAGGGVDDAVPSLVPADHWLLATTRQADTAQLTWGDTLRQGYGHQVWLPGRGGWLLFGMGGQIVYGDPARQIAVVVTADSQACEAGDHRLLDDVMDLLIEPLSQAVPDTVPARTVVVDLAWPTPRHRAAATCMASGTFVNAGIGPGPCGLLLSMDDDGARVRSSPEDAGVYGWDLNLRFDRPAETSVAGRPAVVTAGRPSPDTLDIRCALRGDELTPWRIRLTRADDDMLAVQSEAFGEGARAEWTFHATYRAA